MDNMEFNFEELDHIRQSNNRTSAYQLKRLPDNKFTITDTGKRIIGHDKTMGCDLRAGNGKVLIATRPKDDSRCTRGLLNGASGKIFTSSKLADAIKKWLPEATFYTFVEFQEYQDATYFSIEPDEVQDAPEAEDTDVDGATNVETIPAASEEPVVETTNDDF